MRQNLSESSSEKQYVRNWIRRRYKKINDMVDDFLKYELDESFFREYGESKEMFVHGIVGATWVNLVFKLNFKTDTDSKYLLEELINLYSNSENISKVYDKFSKRF